MNHFKFGVLASIISVFALTSACGGGDDSPATTDPVNGAASDTPGGQPAGDYTGVVITEDLTTGPNRFAVGLLDENGPVLGADVDLTFIKLTSANEGQVRSQGKAEYIELERFYINDGTGEKVPSPAGNTGAYVAQAEFDEVGDWAIQMTGTADGNAFGPINLPFSVSAPEDILSVGDPAPRSRQTITRDVADIREIDTMVPPDAMHDTTIADAVASGKPTVILFGTPAFCETQVCGPVMDAVMVPLSEQYGDQVNFIHVEPYFLDTLRSGNGLCAVPAFNLDLARTGVPEGPGPCPSLTEEQLQAAGESWQLHTEPIVFVVDSEGNIAGKFEAIMSPGEVEDLLSALI